MNTQAIDLFASGIWDASFLTNMKAHSAHSITFGPSPDTFARALRTRVAGVVEKLFETRFPYSAKLSTHEACVNALTLSNGDGRFLASGGDDPFVYIWDLHQNELTRPLCGFFGHKANIFALAFSATNRYIFSGDTDNELDIFDMALVNQQTNEPRPALRVMRRHKDSIRALSGHPQNDELFMSASEDGSVKLHDLRVGGQNAQGVINQKANFTSVQYHPTMPNLFVTGTNTGQVCLRDLRSAFGHSVNKSPAVNTYVTSLSNSTVSSLYVPEVGSVTFDRSGSKLAVTMLYHHPTIYSLLDPYPIATCSGANTPEGSPVPPGKRTYSNCCTIKHGSFGGPGLDTDCYYSAGSDDFRAYVWKVPDIQELEQRRERIAYSRWQNLYDDIDRPVRVGFTSRHSEPRYLPIELSTPLFRLTGHKSIVNTTLIHPSYPLIFTSGVESHILAHSPLPVTHCFGEKQLELTPTSVRALPRANTEDTRLYVRAALAGGRSFDQEDRATIAFFDQILREEGDQDLFDVPSRIWDPSDDEDEDADDEDDDDDDDMYL